MDRFQYKPIRDKQMMAAAEKYADSVKSTFESENELSICLNDFKAGWEMADIYPAWIRVEDGLPQENGKTKQSISVWATNGLISCEMRYNFDTKKWTDMWGDPFDITHWMQLPMPPRKED